MTPHFSGADAAPYRDLGVHDATQSPTFAGFARGAERSELRTVYVQINAQLDKVDFRCVVGIRVPGLGLGLGVWLLVR